MPSLMQEIMGWFDSGDSDTHLIVCAVMAHLHVVVVRFWLPFVPTNALPSASTAIYLLPALSASDAH
ncbi:MAG: hypothetical protein ACYCUM_14580 [Solirubrobacteraceae bacterium]